MSYSTRYLDDGPRATIIHPADIGLIWRVRYWVDVDGKAPFDVQGYPFSESDALQRLAQVPTEYPAWIENCEGNKLLAQNAAKDEYDAGGKWTLSSRLLRSDAQNGQI